MCNETAVGLSCNLRTTLVGRLACALQNGVTLYNCITYLFAAKKKVANQAYANVLTGITPDVKWIDLPPSYLFSMDTRDESMAKILEVAIMRLPSSSMQVEKMTNSS